MQQMLTNVNTITRLTSGLGTCHGPPEANAPIHLSCTQAYANTHAHTRYRQGPRRHAGAHYCRCCYDYRDLQGLRGHAGQAAPGDGGDQGVVARHSQRAQEPHRHRLWRLPGRRLQVSPPCVGFGFRFGCRGWVRVEGYQGAASRSHRARFWLAAIRAAIPVLLDSAPECMHTHATPLLRVAQGAG